MDKPLLLIDVDGPLNPFDVPLPEEPPGYRLHVLTYPAPHKPLGHKTLHVRLSADHGPMLTSLADRFELTWATSWGERANELIGPIVGLPTLPVIDVESTTQFTPYGQIFKRGPVEEYAAGRPLAWFDDMFQPADFDWATQRTADGLPTLLVHINTTIGLCPADIDAVARWWDAVGAAGE